MPDPTPDELRFEFAIASDHPALPGHFPGAPVVPGVLLLAEALQRINLLTNDAIHWTRLERAKFLAPVAPGRIMKARVRFLAREQVAIDLTLGELPAMEAMLRRQVHESTPAIRA